MPDFASGLAGGLESGLQTGAQLGMQQFERGLQQREEERAEQNQQLKVTEASQQQAQQSLTAANEYADDLSRQIHSQYASANPDRNAILGFQKQLSGLQDAKRVAYQHLLGPKLAQERGQAEDTFNGLANGTVNLNDLPNNQFSKSVLIAGGRHPTDFIDTPNSKSPVGQSVDLLHQSMQKGDLNGMNQAFNNLYGHELHQYVGQKAYDGSTVTGADFVGMQPHPGGNDHVTMAIQLTTQGADGRVGKQVIPVMDDNGQIGVHPDDGADATVKKFHFDDLLGHMGATSALYQALNQPQAAQKIIGAYNDGAYEQHQKLLDMMQQLGHNPAEYEPKLNTSMNAGGDILQTDAAGNVVNLQRRPVKVLKPLDQMKSDLEDAYNRNDGAEVARLTEEIARSQGFTGPKDPNAPTVQYQTVNTSQGSYIMPLVSHGRGAGGVLQGAGRAAGVAPTPDQSIGDPDPGGVVPPLPATSGSGPMPSVSAGQSSAVPPPPPGAVASTDAAAGGGPALPPGAIPLPQGSTTGKGGGAKPRSPVMQYIQDWKSDFQKKNNRAPDSEEEATQLAAFGAMEQTKKHFATDPKLGGTARSLNVVVNHLGTLSDLATALGNNDVTLLNKVKQNWSSAFGGTAPANFDAAKPIVADELVKAVLGSGAGGERDREGIQAAVDRAKSPQALAGVIRTWQKLAGGQLSGLRKQYTAGMTLPGQDPEKLGQEFDKTYIDDKTRKALADAESGGGQTPAGPQGAPTRNAKGWQLHSRTVGGKTEYAYIGPKGEVDPVK